MTEPIDFNPSPTAWAAEMRTYLLGCEAYYRTFKDDDARRRYATLTLGGLFERLERVPDLKGLLRLHACRDLLDFFDDIHRGRDHPWRSLGPFGGLQQYKKLEERVRVRALIGLEILIDAAGAKRGAKKAAFEAISTSLASAGHQLSSARVKGLYYELRSGKFPHPDLVSTFVTNFWKGQAAEGSIALCEHGHPVHECADSGGARCVNIHPVAMAYVSGLFVDV